jgi:hypothetical protein
MRTPANESSVANDAGAVTLDADGVEPQAASTVVATNGRASRLIIVTQPV